jgi:hypothetical protein
MEEEAVALFMHEVLFESSSSESDEELVLEELYFLKKRKRRKISNYIEDVVDNYDDQMFRENFRMYRATFELLLHLLEDKISSSVVDVGRHTISSKAQLLLTIWYFATPDSYRLISLLDYLQGNNRIHVSRSICERFNVGKATGLRTVRRVTNALIEISPDFIKWPTDDYLEEVIQGFVRMGFPQTIGCIDGSFIPIPLPKEHGRSSYICRKKFAAIILQACPMGNLLLEQSLRILTFRAYVIINFYSHIAMQEKLVPAMMLKS